MADGAASEADSERLSDQSWNWHREQQLKRLGIDPEDLDQ
jgi:hypothetical protein